MSNSSSQFQTMDRIDFVIVYKKHHDRAVEKENLKIKNTYFKNLCKKDRNGNSGVEISEHTSTVFPKLTFYLVSVSQKMLESTAERLLMYKQVNLKTKIKAGKEIKRLAEKYDEHNISEFITKRDIRRTQRRMTMYENQPDSILERIAKRSRKTKSYLTRIYENLFSRNLDLFQSRPYNSERTDGEITTITEFGKKVKLCVPFQKEIKAIFKETSQFSNDNPLRAVSFNESERIMIAHHILNTTPYTSQGNSDDDLGIGINRLLRIGVFDRAYPLHDSDYSHDYHFNWKRDFLARHIQVIEKNECYRDFLSRNWGCYVRLFQTGWASCLIGLRFRG